MSQDKKRCPLMRKRRHKKQNAARRQKRVREDRRRQEASAQGKLIRELIARFASDHWKEDKERGASEKSD